MKNNVISGIIGAAIMILIIMVVIAFIEPIDYAPIYLLNPEKSLSCEHATLIDSIKCVHLEVLRDLESKGVLMNPSEYTSHIASYYNTLIGFLIGLFAIFTFGTIYSIKYASKKEIEEIKSDINNHKLATKGELKQDIVDSLNELMRDSISFKDSCINALYGRIEDEILRHEDKEVIDNKILKIEENIKLLFEAYDQLEEDKSSTQEIE
jgi:hypothetical protein